MTTPKTERPDAAKPAETAKGGKVPKDSVHKPDTAQTETVEEIGGLECQKCHY